MGPPVRPSKLRFASERAGGSSEWAYKTGATATLEHQSGCAGYRICIGSYGSFDVRACGRISQQHYCLILCIARGGLDCLNG